MSSSRVVNAKERASSSAALIGALEFSLEFELAKADPDPAGPEPEGKLDEDEGTLPVATGHLESK